MSGLAVVTDADLQRRHDLRRMKSVALGLLVAAAALFVATTLAGAEGALGYVQAFAEAAMVGALADWFAVTAIFRHPLGLPIPHTAIIPRRKAQIGRSLGDFVENNFMTSDVLVERLDQAAIGDRVGQWLREPGNADRAASAVGDALRGGIGVLDDDVVQRDLEAMVRDRLRSIPAAPLAGRLIELGMERGHHQRLLDAAIVAAEGFLDENEELFRSRIYSESPWWVPEAVDDRVLAKIYDVVRRFLDDVRRHPGHEMRRAVDRRAAAFARRLADDPELRRRGEELIDEVLDHPEFRSWIESIWRDAKRSIIESESSSDGALHQRLAAAFAALGDRLGTEPELRDRIDEWMRRAATHVAERSRHEVGDLISSTVDRWDATSTSERLELQVGRDLQFVRINGTLVGGLAGVVIHTVAELL